jgi:hypothetical protein
MRRRIWRNWATTPSVSWPHAGGQVTVARGRPNAAALVLGDLAAARASMTAS